MQFKIDNFIVFTKIKTEIFEGKENKIFVPSGITNGRPSDFKSQQKKRDFVIFEKLQFLEFNKRKFYTVFSDLFVFIDLIEVMKAFNGNKLNTEKKYDFSDNFTARIAQKEGNITLEIHFKNYSNSLYLDKFECSSLSAKFSKILSRCEAWQE
jgi:hypothetical protein